MIEIIPLKYEHCEQVYDIARQCLPEHWSLDGIRDVLKYDNNIYFVAVESGHDEYSEDYSDGEDRADSVVGFGGIMVVADEAELLNIAVSDSYRKQGIATKLLDRLLTAAKMLGAYRMLLEVREKNYTAQDLYTKSGFTAIGTRRNYYTNPTDNAIIMETVFDNI